MDTPSLANVKWSPAVNRHFEVMRLETFNQRELPNDHNPWQPHRLHFHALILFTQGQGSHGIDFINYPVKAGTLIHVCASQIHHFGHTQALEALLVLFLPAALPTNLLGLSTSISSPLSWSTIQYIWPPVTALQPSHTQILKQHIELLEAYQTTDSDQSWQASAQYLLWSVIALASQVAVAASNLHQSKPIEPRFLEFVELLEQSFESCRNVKWYAEQIGYSTKTLHRICIATIGKSPKAMINERVVIEAQRRLFFGKTTVNEVGQSLGFEETTNFVKFFRRLVGQSPDEFRMLLKS
ncbi:MAG: AraC family transcriptional regulator [Cyanobacteria bacterium J06635_15]